MIDAKLLATRNMDTGSSYDVYGVWIPRKGDNLRLTAEVVANYGTDLTVTIFQKNYEDTGDGATAGVSTTFNQTTGRKTMELLGCKELIRMKLTLAPGGDLAASEVGLVLFRFLQPVWFETVKV